MLRLVAIVLGLMPSLAAAQSTDFTVSVQSAAVRKSPSTGSPIVGQAPRGAVLEVTRDIGAWVKVTWPEAPDGIGYVHQSMGKIAQRATREERLAAAFASLPPPEPVDMPLLSAINQRRRSICRPRRGRSTFRRRRTSLGWALR